MTIIPRDFDPLNPKDISPISILHIHNQIKWLRDNHGFILWVCPVRSDTLEVLGWYYEGEWINHINRSFYYYPEPLFSSPEEAEQNAIKYAIKTLKS